MRRVPPPRRTAAPRRDLVDYRGKMMQDGADSYVQKGDNRMQYAALIRQLEDGIEGRRDAVGRRQ